jgi:putative spermidine/putrescine transport system substrate-binding protein
MGQSEMTRRSVLKLGGAVVTGVGLGPLRHALATSRPVVITTYGGIVEKVHRDTYVACFKRKWPSVEVSLGVGTPEEFFAKVQASPQNPPVDALIVTDLLALRAKELGLTEAVTIEKVSNLRDVPGQFYEPFGGHAVAYNFGSAGLAYNKERVRRPPESWEEFVERTIKGDFGKRVSIPSVSYSWGPTMTVWNLATAFGGSLDQVDVAFDKIKAMKPNVIKFWTTPQDFLNLLANKEIDIGVYWDGRTYAFADSGNPWVGFINPKPGGIAGVALISKVKNGLDVTWDYINCMLDPDVQLEMAKALKYAGTNAKTAYPPDLAPRIPNLKEMRVPPSIEIQKRLTAWVERWNKEIGR